jgi:hypothetical protein
MTTEEPTRRRIELGVLPIGFSDIFIAEGVRDPVSVLIAEADAKVEAERKERERVAHLTVSVSRLWLIEILRDHLATVESSGVAAYRRGDVINYNSAVRKASALRDEIARYNDAGPTP